eukprot:Rhum_TRINITY_DN15441_c3_g2::Rhum_TRINITY_DN15441_c3_g2_i4::g.154903::m.154903
MPCHPAWQGVGCVPHPSVQHAARAVPAIRPECGGAPTTRRMRHSIPRSLSSYEPACQRKNRCSLFSGKPDAMDLPCSAVTSFFVVSERFLFLTAVLLPLKHKNLHEVHTNEANCPRLPVRSSEVRHAPSLPMPPPAKRQRTTPACDMTVKELRAVLRARGLPVGGVKAELVARVEKARRAEASGDDASTSSSSTSSFSARDFDGLGGKRRTPSRLEVDILRSRGQMGRSASSLSSLLAASGGGGGGGGLPRRHSSLRSSSVGGGLYARRHSSRGSVAKASSVATAAAQAAAAAAATAGGGEGTLAAVLRLPPGNSSFSVVTGPSNVSFRRKGVKVVQPGEVGSGGAAAAAAAAPPSGLSSRKPSATAAAAAQGLPPYYQRAYRENLPTGRYEGLFETAANDAQQFASTYAAATVDAASTEWMRSDAQHTYISDVVLIICLNVGTIPPGMDHLALLQAEETEMAAAHGGVTPDGDAAQGAEGAAGGGGGGAGGGGGGGNGKGGKCAGRAP